MKTFGERLRHIITVKWGSIEDFANIIDVSTQQVYGYCNDKYQPKSKVIEILAQQHVNLNWLFTGEGEMFEDANLVKEPQVPYLIAGDIQAPVPKNAIIEQIENMQRLLKVQDLDMGAKMFFLNSALQKILEMEKMML